MAFLFWSDALMGRLFRHRICSASDAARTSFDGVVLLDTRRPPFWTAVPPLLAWSEALFAFWGSRNQSRNLQTAPVSSYKRQLKNTHAVQISVAVGTRPVGQLSKQDKKIRPRRAPRVSSYSQVCFGVTTSSRSGDPRGRTFALLARLAPNGARVDTTPAHTTPPMPATTERARDNGGNTVAQWVWSTTRVLPLVSKRGLRIN